MYKNLVTTVIVTLVAACLSSPAFSQTAVPSSEALKIGFVYVAPLTAAGWVRQHEEARKAVEAALGDRVKTVYVENVAEGAGQTFSDAQISGMNFLAQGVPGKLNP